MAAEVIDQEVILTLGQVDKPLLDVTLSEEMNVDVIQTGVPQKSTSCPSGLKKCMHTSTA